MFEITWSADHAADVTVIASSKVNTISNVSPLAYSPAVKSTDRMLAVMTPVRGGIEPRLLGVEKNRCYYVEMTIDTNYRVFP